MESSEEQTESWAQVFRENTRPAEVQEKWGLVPCSWDASLHPLKWVQWLHGQEPDTQGKLFSYIAMFLACFFPYICACVCVCVFHKKGLVKTKIPLFGCATIEQILDISPALLPNLNAPKTHFFFPGDGFIQYFRHGTYSF